MNHPALSIVEHEERDQSPWMTRREAMAYLSVGHTKLDGITIRMQDKREPGKVRATTLEGQHTYRPPVRLWADDVRALLKGPGE